MLKYFSSILSKFTPPQRISVIVLLILAIVTVTLGPFIIKGYRPDNKELRNRMDQIQKDNIGLNQRVSSLNTTIIENQQECTNKIVEREKEIISQLDELENKIKTLNVSTKESNITTLKPEIIFNNDTINIKSISSNKEDTSLMRNENFNSILKEVKSIKSNIKKKLKEN